MKCLAKDRNQNPCRNSATNDRFCRYHDYMISYTPEMLSEIKLCSTCKKMHYLGEYNTCEKCRLRGQDNRKDARENIILCAKEGCSFKKSDENNYCGKHQCEYYVEETLKSGMIPCSNYKYKNCRNPLPKEYQFKRCDECREKEREYDHSIRKAAAEEPCQIQGMKTCSVCCKDFTIEMFKGNNGETKTCKNCRVSYKIADEKRDKEHVNELARINSQKPERKEVKKEWKENNYDKVVLYWMNYRQRKMNEDLDNYLKHNAEIQKNWRSLNTEKVIEYNEARINNIHYSFQTYKKSALTKQLHFELNIEYFTELVKDKCYYCGKIQDKGFNGLDRIDSKFGYIENNCVSSCKMCNMMKCCLSLDVFKNIIEHILVYNKLIEGKLYPESFHNYNPVYNNYVNSASKKELNFDIDKEIYDSVTFNSCYLCGKENTDNHHNGLDRYDSSVGYVYDNIRPCCGTCNYMKKNLKYNDFMNKCLEIYHHFIKNIDNNNEDKLETNTNFIVKGNKLTKEQKEENRMKRNEKKKSELKEKYNNEEYKKQHSLEVANERKNNIE
jgi:hypothetical protein